MPPSSLEARARSIALSLTRWPSVTGTTGEAALPERLAGLLRELPYFAANPQHLMCQSIPGDPLGRSNVLAFVQGAGSDLVTLSGHFDTVPVDDYAELAPLATEPEALAPALVQRLQATGTHALARDDLASGEFLPGRGLLDMKSGLAAGIAVLEAFAADPERRGNLLLIATADEEDRSVGMRAAADALPALFERFGVRPALGINLDALIDTGDGTDGRIMALGCVGKLLLSALVVGRDAHACYPLNGVNGAYLAAELVCAMEYATELGQEYGAELASPPTVLGSRDLKPVYNVTTPSRVWTTWNVLSHRRSAAEVLRIAAELAQEAMRRALTRMQERAGRLAYPPQLNAGWQDIAVLSFAELRTLAVARDSSFVQRFAERAVELMARPDLDLPQRCRELTELTWDAAGFEGPAIVLGFASMPYPAVNFADDALEQRLRAVAARVAAAQGMSITAVRHLPVIVDMSFLGQVDAEDLASAAENTPVWGSSIQWDLSRGGTPGIPMVNVGPWGRDYHHWLERVHAPYAFGVLPGLVRDLVLEALA